MEEFYLDTAGTGVEALLTAPITVLLVGVMVTTCAFFFLERITRSPSDRILSSGLRFGSVNGLFSLLLEAAIGPVSPIGVVLLPAVLIAAEYALIRRDDTFFHLYVFGALLLNFACLYNIAAASTRLLPVVIASAENPAYRFLVYDLTALLAVLMLGFLSLSRHFPREELRRLMHSPERGLLLLCYIAASDLILLISLWITTPLMREADIPPSIGTAFYGNLLLWTALILLCSYLIAWIQCRQELQNQHYHLLDDELSREKSFRDNLHRDALLCYSANITRARIEEGACCFSADLLARCDSYFQLLREVAFSCVHPEDRDQLLQIGGPQYFENRLRTAPAYTLRLRISPHRMLAVTHLPPAVRARLLAAGKEWIWVEFQCTVTRDPAGEIHVYVALTDVDSAVREMEGLRQAAEIDRLTGVYGRGSWEARAREALSQEGAEGALFVVDLDFFKQVNDQLGHPAGDRLLQETAHLLRSVFREGDLIGRLGGDEFCIYAAGLCDRALVERRAAELCHRRQGTLPLPSGGELSLSFSIGVALFPGAGDSFEVLYRHADAALYEAKRAGRGTWRIYQAPDVPG